MPHEVNETTQHPFDLPARGAEIDGRYKVVDPIGAGSYGWVFAVEHTLLGQTFAMKLLHPRVATDPSWIVRFREEAKSTGLIGHENIVFVTDFGQCATYGYYFVMEHLEGPTLDEALGQKEPMGLARSLRIILQVGSALSAAHDLGIVHRDLKPGNLMLVQRSDGSEMCKTLDFGISSIVMAATETTKLYGTPAYMAPEQAIQPEVDHRADQFSLACILYEMLTARRPWRVDRWMDATPTGRQKPPPPPSQVNPELPESIDAPILRALSVAFEARWPSIDAFCRALVGAVQIEVIPKSDPFDLPWDEQTVADDDAPQVTVSERGAGESMVIVVDDDSEEADVQVRPLVTVRFRSADRLFREYRRNLLAGGLFLPTDERLPLNTDIELCLIYEPGADAIELRAEVVAHSPGGGHTPGGFGVAIARDEQPRLVGFLRGLRLGLELYQADMLHPLSIPSSAGEDLSAGEAFLLSRIDEPMAVARVRALGSGLPFDIEQVIQSLIERGYLHVEPADTSSISEVSAVSRKSEQATELPTEANDDHAQPSAAELLDDQTRFPWSEEVDDGSLEESTSIVYSRQEVSRVLSLVRYFKARQNYLGALAVLRKALEVSPSVAEFYHQLAVLHADFRGDYPRALQALHGAIQLDPQDPRYTELRRRLERLGGFDD
jgi:serine/threonine protein kinase/tetratricopeptide (TPR) repeat protein